MGNIHVKLYEIWTSVSGGDVVSRHFLSRTLATIWFSGLDHLCNFEKKGVMRNNPVKSFCIWINGSGGNSV